MDRGEECNGAGPPGFKEATRGQRWLREGGDLEDRFSEATDLILLGCMSDLENFACAAARASAHPTTLRP